jgi:hypothetical protein
LHTTVKAQANTPTTLQWTKTGSLEFGCIVVSEKEAPNILVNLE